MANGLFNLKQVMQAVQQGGWPAQKTPAVEYLVVAGGGGGGYLAGGGGAGGLLMGIDPVPNGQTLLVTVGGGGASATSGVNSVFGAISSTGGGAGGSNSATAGASGGSGGGANNSGGTGGTIGQGISGQGNAGGLSWAGSNYTGGGGGGAGTVGLNSVATNDKAAGNGGAGIASAINGTVTTYAGGGGGAADTNGTGGAGGVGGGGAGGVSRGATGGSGTVNGVSGTTNTGGGGGGYGVAGTGGSGGSGIVIVSYPDVYAAPTATTGSPTVSTSGSGSLAFSSNTQLLTYPTNAGYAFGTGDYTIEGWVYINGVQANSVATIVGATGTGGLVFSLSGGTTPTSVSINPYGSGNTVTASFSFSLSTWYHIAVARSSGSTKIFVNGTQYGTTTTDNTNYAQQPMALSGVAASGSQNLNGYISNIRLVKGTAVYTANFTAPTAPLTAITNTTMLLNSVSGAQFADGSTLSAVATLSGSPVWNQLSPFATGTGYKNRVYTWTSSGSITF